MAEEALQKAKQYGVITSYDLNYRPSLWKAIGGRERAQKVNACLAPLIDAMIGNEEDFMACLGFEVEGVDENLTQLSVEGYKRMIKRAVEAYPNFIATVTTLRTVKTATKNDWGHSAGTTAISMKQHIVRIWRFLIALEVETVSLPVSSMEYKPHKTRKRQSTMERLTVHWL